MQTRSLILLLVGASLAGGCTGGYRIGVGPTLDTELDVGVALTVGGYFGLGGDDGVAFAPVVEGGPGVRFNQAAPTLDLAVGWDVLSIEEGDVALRVGPRMVARWVFDNGGSGGGAAQHVGLMGAFAGSLGGMRRYHLGVELRAGVLFDDGFFESGARGAFALSLVYERVATWDVYDIFG